MTDPTDLPNIGPHLAHALAAAGIETPDALREVGSVEAWWRIHPTYDCINSLLALEGAVQGVPKSELDDATRQWLREQARVPRVPHWTPGRHPIPKRPTPPNESTPND